MHAERLQGQRETFRRATQRLADALAQPKDEFIRDSAIQRFEFTFEIAWKTLKVIWSVRGWWYVHRALAYVRASP